MVEDWGGDEVGGDPVGAVWEGLGARKEVSDADGPQSGVSMNAWEKREGGVGGKGAGRN